MSSLRSDVKQGDIFMQVTLERFYSSTSEQEHRNSISRYKSSRRNLKIAPDRYQ